MFHFLKKAIASFASSLILPWLLTKFWLFAPNFYSFYNNIFTIKSSNNISTVNCFYKNCHTKG